MAFAVPICSEGFGAFGQYFPGRLRKKPCYIIWPQSSFDFWLAVHTAKVLTLSHISFFKLVKNFTSYWKCFLLFENYICYVTDILSIAIIEKLVFSIYYEFGLSITSNQWPTLLYQQIWRLNVNSQSFVRRKWVSYR